MSSVTAARLLGVSCAVPDGGLILNSEHQNLMISRRHARFYCEGGTWRVADMKSLNWMLVNGVKKYEAVLHDRDLITFGGAGACEIDQRPGPKVCKMFF